MDQEQGLYGLMRLAREQQAAVMQALAALAGEREALESERAGWKAAVEELKVADALQTAVKLSRNQLAQTGRALTASQAQLEQTVRGLAAEQAQILAAVTQGVEKAAREALEASLVRWEGQGVAALQSGLVPLEARTEALSAQVGAAAGRLERAGRWFTWKWLLLGFCLLAGLFTASSAALYWQGQALKEMQATMAVLEEKGGKVKLTQCGVDTKRLCAEIDVKANQSTGGWGEEGQYMILKGY